MSRKRKWASADAQEIDDLIAWLNRRALISFLMSEDSAKRDVRIAQLLKELKELRVTASHRNGEAP